MKKFNLKNLGSFLLNNIGIGNIYSHKEEIKSSEIDFHNTKVNKYSFFGYEDGIYEIEKSDYIGFYESKKIEITFKREVNVLYMLKKNGYYCFIHKSDKGRLAILNGGSIKNLPNDKNINYYYDNMDTMIDIFKKPLDRFTNIQNDISNTIKKIGGSGKIHGTIIDIDFFNHIYLNPIDLKITGYYANNIVDKTVYPSVLELLKVRCPDLFDKYMRISHMKNNFEKHSSETALVQYKLPKLLGSNIVDLSIRNSEISRAVKYKSTDIYNLSRKIKNIQKLHSNILSFWYDEELYNDNSIEDKKSSVFELLN